MLSSCNSDSIFKRTTKKVLIRCQVLSSHFSPYCFPCSLLGGMQKLVHFESVLFSLWIWVAAVEIFHLSFSPSEGLVEGSNISFLSIFSLPVTIHLLFCPSSFPGSLYTSATKASILSYGFPFNVFVEVYWR